MNNTEKRLEEFEKSFWLHRVPNHTKQMKDIKSFIATSITQAIAEERERVREKAKGVRDNLLVYFHNAVNDQKAPYRHAIQAVEEELLSSQDKPLTDKE